MVAEPYFVPRGTSPGSSQTMAAAVPPTAIEGWGLIQIHAFADRVFEDDLVVMMPLEE